MDRFLVRKLRVQTPQQQQNKQPCIKRTRIAAEQEVIILDDDDDHSFKEIDLNNRKNTATTRTESKRDAFSILTSAAKCHHSPSVIAQSVPGLSLICDLVPNEGEIIAFLKNEKCWRPVGSAATSRRIIQYGFAYSTSSTEENRLREARQIPDVLKPLQHIAEELSQRELRQCLVNEYLPGQGISEHIDKTDVFGDTVVGFSLGSAAVLIFRHPDGRTVDLDLPVKSMYIMTGEARYVWSHQMPARLKDGARLRGVRYAITFRNVKPLI